jgi:ATP-independent RNA helicase DbpA
MRGQITSLEKGAHIVVGTPGRLQDHLSRETLPLYDIKTLVLDEADRMLDMGFYDAIVKIISNLPKNRQTMLFSATFPDKIEHLSRSILKSPESIKAASAHKASIIKQLAYRVGYDEKQKSIVQILKSYRPSSVLIFCNTKQDTEDLADYLYDQGFSSQALNGNLNQKERNETLLSFANGSMPLLTATDVASRGLDVKEIELIINYDLPFDPEVYIHRIGRTGRAGARGVAVSLYTPNQTTKITEIAPEATLETISSLRPDKDFILCSNVVTLCIDGGKRSKLRAGDILGTLCKDIGIDAKNIGKIDIYETQSYVAVEKSVANRAYNGIKNGKIKKRKYRVWRL